MYECRRMKVFRIYLRSAKKHHKEDKLNVLSALHVGVYAADNKVSSAICPKVDKLSFDKD